MSGSTDIVKDFKTPERSTPKMTLDIMEEKKDLSPKEAVTDTSKSNAATVTPPESGISREESKKLLDSPSQMVSSQVDSPEDRHVRFDKEMKLEENEESPVDSPSSTGSQRGLVSRRGGRCASPGRAVKPGTTKDSSALELKSFRSPTANKREESDTVPSLCSASSESKVKKGTVIKKEDSESSISNQGDKKPASISCDTTIHQTSPLASHDAEGSEIPKTAKVKVEDKASSRKNNVTFSPVPPPKESISDKVSR